MVIVSDKSIKNAHMKDYFCFKPSYCVVRNQEMDHVHYKIFQTIMQTICVELVYMVTRLAECRLPNSICSELQCICASFDLSWFCTFSTISFCFTTNFSYPSESIIKCIKVCIDERNVLCFMIKINNSYRVVLRTEGPL